MEFSFESVDANSVDAFNPEQSVRELRKTVKGRHELVKRGKSVNNGGRTPSRIPATNRRFVAWDGEGETVWTRRINGVPWLRSDHLGETHRSEHRYILFGNSDGYHVSGPNLSTYECLSLLIDAGDTDAIHFGFAFGYDANMILKDLSRKHLERLAEKNNVTWGRYRIEYIPRKWFMVTDTRIRKTIKIWDIWSFFMTSFVKACEQYGIVVDEIVSAGKSERDVFTYANIDYVYKYWARENEQAVQLAEKFREVLYGADLFITSWHGPGSIASYSMAQHEIQRYKGETPDDVYDACQYAYAGGRFELFKVGRANKPVYQYDINSAYPYAISQLPSLANGYWRHVEDVQEIQKFAVYRIRFRHNPYTSDLRRPMPFVYRNERGGISYPCIVDTWIWSPEMALAISARIPGVEILEGWEFVEHDENIRPFAFIAENYELRRKWKDAGNPSQLALKLQMNSMYGKMAQRVGWNEAKRQAPKWHQLDWAGWVTSYTRAKLYRAMLQAGSDLVSVETDAVFSTRELNLDLGNELGQWGETVYDDLVYMQSGCYFGLNPRENGKLKYDGWIEKYRGFDRGSITLEKALEALGNEPGEWKVTGTTTRFVGFKQALHADFSAWRTWESNRNRLLSMGTDGKRTHNVNHCRGCNSGIPASETFHDLSISDPIGGESTKHQIPWIDEALDEVQELADRMKWEV